MKIKILIVIIGLLLPVILNARYIQWASEIIGYSTQLNDKQFSAAQALGEPNASPGYSQSSVAWSPLTRQSSKPEWLHVGFENPMQVSHIVISEILNPGVITRVYLYDSAGNEELVYSKQPVTNTQKGRILDIFIDRTAYKVHSLKLMLRTDAVRGWNQIDAVGISDSPEKYEFKIDEIGYKAFDSEPENLGNKINSYYYELLPVISPDGRTLYFTRFGHPDNIGIRKKEDIWYSKLDSAGNFQEAKILPEPVNNEHSNFTFSLTQDGNGLLLGNVYRRNGAMGKGVSISYRTGSRWNFPDKLNIQGFSNKSQYAEYFLSSSGRELLLSIEMDDTYGGRDIYVSRLNRNGTWSRPRNLGPSINTAADDSSPFLAADGKSLFYSTTGYPGYGQSDIFISRRKDTTWFNWEKPKNLGPKINTEGLDQYFSISANGEYGYFVSNQNSIGADDIFRIKLPPELSPRIVAIVSGRVINSKTNEPLDARIIYETLPDGNEAGIAKTDPSDGSYQIVLPAGRKYGFMAEADGFIAVNENMDLSATSSYGEIKRDLYMVPLEVGQTVRLNNIFFEYGKYNLLEDSYSELNRVVELMKNNTGIRIEITGHTDDIGSLSSNMVLSRNRAQAVKDYLLDKGINSSRLISKGMGPKEPLVGNTSEENRQKNRRVEFRIISK